MTSAEGYGVDPAVLDTHAELLDELVDRLHKVREAADEADNISPQIYGAIGSIVLSFGLRPFDKEMHAVVQAAANLGDGLSANLKSASKNYQQLEEESASLTSQIEEEL